MDRKMFKAEKNFRMPAGDALSAWFSLLVKFPSPVMFAIGVMTMRKLNLVVNAKLKSEKNLQLLANNGLTILYVVDDVLLMDCVLTFYDILCFGHFRFQFLT